MQAQPTVWLLQVQPSELATNLRIGCAAFFVLIAATLTLWVSPIGGGIAWWGEWLWLWPLLVFVCWQLLSGRAPILPAQAMRLTETGRVPGYVISEPLVTPFAVALRLRTDPASTALVPAQLVDVGADGGWQWVFKDQLSSVDWTRLRRVCRHVKHRGS